MQIPMTLVPTSLRITRSSLAATEHRAGIGGGSWRGGNRGRDSGSRGRPSAGPARGGWRQLHPFVLLLLLFRVFARLQALEFAERVETGRPLGPGERRPSDQAGCAIGMVVQPGVPVLLRQESPVLRPAHF